jgi:hypothetical protein
MVVEAHTIGAPIVNFIFRYRPLGKTHFISRTNGNLIRTCSYSGCPRQDRRRCRRYGTSDSAFVAADQKVRHPNTCEEAKNIRGNDGVP